MEKEKLLFACMAEIYKYRSKPTATQVYQKLYYLVMALPLRSGVQKIIGLAAYPMLVIRLLNT